LGGGSFVIEQGCRTQESAALSGLKSRAAIDPEILQNCIEMTNVAGASYVLLSGCIDQEKSAKIFLN